MSPLPPFSPLESLIDVNIIKAVVFCKVGLRTERAESWVRMEEKKLKLKFGKIMYR